MVTWSTKRSTARHHCSLTWGGDEMFNDTWPWAIPDHVDDAGVTRMDKARNPDHGHKTWEYEKEIWKEITSRISMRFEENLEQNIGTKSYTFHWSNYFKTANKNNFFLDLASVAWALQNSLICFHFNLRLFYRHFAANTDAKQARIKNNKYYETIVHLLKYCI